ncbi:MAG: prepilin-type cleavage/methylation domain-containing protein, partial [Anaerolineales bacterium]
IGILAAIALPAYQNYTIKSAERACLAEAKAYMNTFVAEVADSSAATSAPQAKACTAPVAAPAYVAGGTVTFTPKTPGVASITCEMDNGNCAIGTGS